MVEIALLSYHPIVVVSVASACSSLWKDSVEERDQGTPVGNDPVADFTAHVKTTKTRSRNARQIRSHGQGRERDRRSVERGAGVGTGAWRLAGSLVKTEHENWLSLLRDCASNCGPRCTGTTAIAYSYVSLILLSVRRIPNLFNTFLRDCVYLFGCLGRVWRQSIAITAITTNCRLALVLKVHKILEFVAAVISSDFIGGLLGGLPVNKRFPLGLYLCLLCTVEDYLASLKLRFASIFLLVMKCTTIVLFLLRIRLMVRSVRSKNSTMVVHFIINQIAAGSNPGGSV